MKKIRTAVVGVGHLGQHHARILNEIPGADLVAVADSNIARAREIGERLGVPYVSDYRELPAGLDAVSVAAPTGAHFEIASWFLKKNLDVLVEKPITNSCEEARTLVSLARRRKRILQVGHVERFNGAVLHLKKYVRNPLFIEIHRLSPFPERSTDVGVVLDLMIHDLDILLYLVKSPIVRIEPVGARVLTDKEDIANVRMEFKSGCIVNLTSSRMSSDVQRRLRVFQVNNYISLDYKNQSLVRFQFPKRLKKRQVPRQKDIEVIPVPVQKTEPLRLELEHFIRSIRARKKPSVSGEEGRDVLQLAMRILDKMKLNR